MKSGLEYFPLDVHMDDKIALIEAEFGLTGFAVIVKLYQKIYGSGYYCEWTNEVALLFGRKIGLGGSAVSEIVRAAIKRGIFDKDLYDKYHILTSAGIQKRYFEAVSRRKRVEVEKTYLLYCDTTNFKNVYISGENADTSEKNAYINEQSKVEESRVKESRGEAPPTRERLEAQYGKATVADYIARARRYRKKEDDVLFTVAAWMEQDAKKGGGKRAAAPQVENSSLDMGEYAEWERDFVPVYHKKEHDK